MMRQQKHRVLVFLLFLCSLFLFSRADGQNPLLPPKPSFRSFNATNGLPSSETYATLQDRNGYLWIATDRGIARFDGYRFKVFTINDGLLDNVILFMYEDYKGRVWFISLTGLLCYYENGKIVRYKYNDLIVKHSLGSRTGCRQIRVLKNGTIIYSVRGLGAFIIDANGKVTEKTAGVNGVYLVEQWGDELFFYLKIPVFQQGGLIWYKKTPLTLKRHGKTYYPGSIENALDTRLEMHQSQILILEGRNVHIMFNDHVVQLTKGNDAIGVYSDGHAIWVGYYKKGVYKYLFDPKTETLKEIGHFFAGYSVSSTLKDSEGGYWFTTLESGVMYMPFPNVAHYTTQNGLSENYVCSINGIGSNIFALSGSGHIQQMNAPWISFGNKNITRLQLQRFRNRLIITGNPGVEARHPLFMNIEYRNLPMQRVRTTVAEEVFANDKQIIAFCGGGLVSINTKGEHTLLYRVWRDQAYKRIHEVFDALVFDEKGTIYAGNRAGLYKVANKQVFSMDELDSTFKIRVSDLAYDRTYGFIAGTRGKGIYFFRNDKILWGLTEKSGLLSNQVNFVYLDDARRLWVGTNKGLNLIIFRNGRVQIQQFTTKNGLISNEINAVYVDCTAKKIWVATKIGISVLPLETDERSQQPSFLFLGGIRTLKGEQPLLRHYYEAGTSFMEITFRTTNYKAAPHHLFRYRLHPEDPWIVAYEPKITLNDPSPGDYSVEVSYRDGNGTWIIPKKIYSFTINSPFWMKWYFFVACFLVFSAIVFYMFRLRIKQISRRHYYETRISQLEQKALSAQMNPHFIFNSLNSIQSFLVYEENEKAERYLLKFSSLIRQTLANSRERYIRIEQEIKILKDYLELEQMRFKNKFSFEIQSSLSATEIQCFIPPMLVQPYVENAVLHGIALLQSGGKVKIVFAVEEGNNLIIIIDDNGVGRKATSAKKKTGHRSFGTTITQERLRFFNKDFENRFRVDIIDKTQDGKSQGTRIVLQLPIRTYYEPEDSGHY